MSQGHLELFAWVPGRCLLDLLPCQKFLPTLSALALESASYSIFGDYKTNPAAVIARLADGDSTVLFDQYGVGGAPASWTTVAGMISNPPMGSMGLSVAWSVGSYTVNGANKIYALICAPSTPGQYPMVVYNHGGINFSGGE
jgi:hypothetical protein